MLSGGRPVLGFPEQFEIKIYTILGLWKGIRARWEVFLDL
jgi:hypothetical protein